MVKVLAASFLRIAMLGSPTLPGQVGQLHSVARSTALKTRRPASAYRQKLARDSAHAWLARKWIGRCFPGFVADVVGTDGHQGPFDRPLQAEAPINGGDWLSLNPKGVFRRSVISAERRIQSMPEPLSLGYDRNRQIAIFQHVEWEQELGGYIADLDEPPKGLPRVDAAEVRAHGLPVVDPVSLRPTIGDLRAIAAPLPPLKSCGLRMYSFYRPDVGHPISLDVIFDSKNNPEAVMTFQGTGG